MKKYLFNNLKIILIGIILAVGASYALARPWACPGGTADTSCGLSNAPANNILSPLDVSSTSQTKSGDLSVWTFAVNQNATFAKDKFVFFDYDPSNGFYGFLRGGSVDKPTDSITIGDQQPVTMNVSGKLSVAKNATFSNLANSELLNICGDKDGNVVLCNPPQGNVCSNIPDSTTVPPGYWRNADGTCSAPIDVCSNLYGNQPSVPTNYIARGDGTCYKQEDLIATVDVADSCDAAQAHTGGFFPVATSVPDSNEQLGHYTLRFTFDKPTPAPSTLKLITCTAFPGGTTQFLGYDSWADELELCSGDPTLPIISTALDNDGTGHSSSIGGRDKDRNNDGKEDWYDIDADWSGTGSTHSPHRIFTDMSDSNKDGTKDDKTPLSITVPQGATSITTPQLLCSRNGRSKKLLYSKIYKINASFATTQNDALQWSVTANTPSSICLDPNNSSPNC